MGTYTVIGLIDTNACELLVAGVVEDDVQCVESTPESAGYQRWADTVEADDANEAERKALYRFSLEES